jgi:hypothetical protein
MCPPAQAELMLCHPRYQADECVRDDMASLARRGRPWVGCIAIAGALSACESHPAPPLLSPIAVAGAYGYSDLALGDNRYQISYAGPSQRSLRAPSARETTVAAERTQAYDFALWHAAQVTLAQGFIGFRVSNVRTNVDTLAEDYEPFYGPPFYPYHRFWEPYGPYSGPYLGPSPYIYTRTEIVFDITLLHSLDPGDYDARDTIDQLNRTYPGAAGPVAPS